MGWFSGRRPTGLGFDATAKPGGAFKPCSWKPNCVSSTTDAITDTAHYIAPLTYTGNPAKTWAAAVALVKAAPRATVVTASATYLHAEYRSKAMGYVDDVELALDAKAGLIHIRSASRLGVRDFGVNRARAEALRAALAAKLDKLPAAT